MGPGGEGENATKYRTEKKVVWLVCFMTINLLLNLKICVEFRPKCAKRRGEVLERLRMR